ncbi:hypothetical protein EI94DRAFT_1211596 [Lactarius quietus]|nr:hypothetical protein EI94DRAFT_1211596 [Lactarius quietus]
MSSTSFYTANSSPWSWYSSAGRTVKTISTALSNNSYHYSVTSVNSYKSRKNVLYPRRVHPPPAALPPVTQPQDIMLPECVGIASLGPGTLAWEVRYLCVVLLPHSEARLLPAGRVLLASLWQESLSSQHNNEGTHHCSELFIMLTREILLRDAIGVEELEGPCRLLHLTFRDILFESGVFDSDMPTTSNLDETGLCGSRAEAQAPEGPLVCSV